MPLRADGNVGIISVSNFHTSRMPSAMEKRSCGHTAPIASVGLGRMAAGIDAFCEYAHRRRLLRF
jgi:hypothetical protein